MGKTFVINNLSEMCGAMCDNIVPAEKERVMNHDATHCLDFCSDCPMKCYRAELEVDLRSRWTEFIKIPLSYAHLYGTEECPRDAYHKESGADE